MFHENTVLCFDIVVTLCLVIHRCSVQLYHLFFQGVSRGGSRNYKRGGLTQGTNLLGKGV